MLNEANERPIICVVGLGYVGLPLAVLLSEKFTTIGFDICHSRISNLRAGIDSTNEVSKEDLANHAVTLTHDESDLLNANLYIVTVPTPVNKYKSPDLSSLMNATKLISKFLAKGNLVIYESTVYPGTTEEICIPILEEHSGLSCNIDFFVGYSPERVNPGDETRKISAIKKVVSGSNDYALKQVEEVYGKIIAAGVHAAESIKVAEASKIVENIQRDVNIALINEFKIIFDALDVDIYNVLSAARTKWNFLDFRPGLVGGHCISIDPYYLSYKASELNMRTEILNSARFINLSMAKYEATLFVKKLSATFPAAKTKKILILGITFKENCNDMRNSMVEHLASEIRSFGWEIDAYDPLVTELPTDWQSLNLISSIKENNYAGIYVAVAHRQFINWGYDKIKTFGVLGAPIVDLKSCITAD